MGDWDYTLTSRLQEKEIEGPAYTEITEKSFVSPAILFKASVLQSLPLPGKQMSPRIAHIWPHKPNKANRSSASQVIRQDRGNATSKGLLPFQCLEFKNKQKKNTQKMELDLEEMYKIQVSIQ